MATIIILLGSIVGLVGAITAYVGFEASFLAALSVWVAAGPVSALFIILLGTILPTRADQRPILAEVA